MTKGKLTPTRSQSANKNHYCEFLSVLDQPAFILNIDGEVLECNSMLLELYEISRAELISHNIFTFCNNNYIAPPLTTIDNTLHGYLTQTSFGINKNGVEFTKTIQWSASQIKNGIYTNSILIIGFEITDLINESTREKYIQNSVIDHIPNHYIFWKDINSVYLGCNTALAFAVGLKSSSEIIGKTDYDLPTPKEQSDAYRADDIFVMKTGKPKLNIEENQTLSDGVQRTISTSKIPLLNAQGNVYGVLAIYSDITERKKLELSLEKAKNKAETANKTKAAFIANMSHDLRTPLTGILGLSTLIADSALTSDEKENAHMIHDSGEQLLVLLNGILDVIAADNLGENDVYNESFDLRQLIESIIQLERPTTQLRKLALHVDIDKDVPTYIISDRTKLHRVLLNLLGNAIKFTKIGSITLKVTCLNITATDVHLQLDVKDTGIGIPLEFQDKVFDRFYRVTPSYKGTYAGHGVGLDIAQSYIKLLGGHITLTSQEGVGTTFHVDLPCKIDNKKDLALQKPLLPTEEEKIIPLSNKSLTPPLGVETIFNNKKATTNDVPYFLLIEDNSMALKVLESIVSKSGCKYTSVMNGEEAFELMKSTVFDLVITDIGLPGISGTELTSAIHTWEKENDRAPQPIVGLTGHAREAAYDECIAAGMNDVFTKPANEALIQHLIKTLVSNTHHNNTPPTIEKDESNTPTSGGLGKDLPNTEAELFQLTKYPVFDPKIALEHVNELPLLFEILNDYLSKQGQNDISLMKKAYEENDWGTVENLTHKLKGGAMYMGTCRMQYACQYLERYYKANHRALLEQLYHQLVAVNDETCKELNAWLKKCNINV